MSHILDFGSNERVTLNVSKAAFEAINIAVRFSQIDGCHHKAWVIDQMMVMLLGADYDEFITLYKKGDDGPNTYEWNKGIAP